MAYLSHAERRRSVNYWQRWIGDWKRKTAHLSACEKGIYGELLDFLYATDTALLPLDHRSVCRIAGASDKQENEAVEVVLAQFFKQTEDGYLSTRTAEELQRRTAFVGQQRERGAAGAQKRWGAEKIPHKINGADKSMDTSAVVERIPLIGGEEFEVQQSFVDEMNRLYLNVDIVATLREIRGWCIGNPTKLKTQRGVRKFIVAWIQREQDKPRAHDAPNTKAAMSTACRYCQQPATGNVNGIQHCGAHMNNALDHLPAAS